MVARSRSLSAGRVQSPALRMIVEREEEIEAFKPMVWKLYQAIDACNQVVGRKSAPTASLAKAFGA